LIGFRLSGTLLVECPWQNWMKDWFFSMKRITGAVTSECSWTFNEKRREIIEGDVSVGEVDNRVYV
jgi:hypothetical protein